MGFVTPETSVGIMYSSLQTKQKWVSLLLEIQATTARNVKKRM